MMGAMRGAILKICIISEIYFKDKKSLQYKSLIIQIFKIAPLMAA